MYQDYFDEWDLHDNQGPMWAVFCEDARYIDVFHRRQVWFDVQEDDSNNEAIVVPSLDEAWRQLFNTEKPKRPIDQYSFNCAHIELYCNHGGVIVSSPDMAPWFDIIWPKEDSFVLQYLPSRYERWRTCAMSPVPFLTARRIARRLNIDRRGECRFFVVHSAIAAMRVDMYNTDSYLSARAI